MRDQYAGDVSDYLKYAFLRAMVEPGTSLGMAWYYLSGHDGRADGRHEEYLTNPLWAALDPDLFRALKSRTGRSVGELEGMEFWPAGTSFHRESVPVARARVPWAEAMIASLQDVDAVFADPDNGVSREGVVSRKSATISEIRALAADGRTLYLIRFPHRQASHDDQLRSYHEVFGDFRPATLRTCVRVLNRNGSSSPRIRWFSVLNGDATSRERLARFSARVSAIPGAKAELA
ncbi:MAG: hypothetical protein V4820_07350 [Pseudomonadota bacterium]